jgi:hypothetical protein
VAIVSSGDESADREHIHPRATLMAASGNTGRADIGLVFTTELAAFFAMRHRRATAKRVRPSPGAPKRKRFTVAGERGPSFRCGLKG